jgi:hypothetical protein
VAAYWWLSERSSLSASDCGTPMLPSEATREW